MRSLPLILTLDQHGVPHRWVSWQQAVWYYAKERVAWEVGNEAFTVYGGRPPLPPGRARNTPHQHIPPPRQRRPTQDVKPLPAAHQLPHLHPQRLILPVLPRAVHPP